MWIASLIPGLWRLSKYVLSSLLALLGAAVYWLFVSSSHQLSAAFSTCCLRLERIVLKFDNRTRLRIDLGEGRLFWLPWACSESECRIFGRWHHQPSTCQPSPPGSLVGELSGPEGGTSDYSFTLSSLRIGHVRHKVCSILRDSLVIELAAWGIPWLSIGSSAAETSSISFQSVTSDQETNSEVIQTGELRIPNGDLPVGGWVVGLEGTLASIAIVAFFRECEVWSEAQVLFNKRLPD